MYVCMYVYIALSLSTLRWLLYTLVPLKASSGVAIGFLSSGVLFSIIDEGEYLSTTTYLSTAYEYCSPGGNVVVIRVFVNLRF
jgi:hypothetical protein